MGNFDPTDCGRSSRNNQRERAIEQGTKQRKGRNNQRNKEKGRRNGESVLRREAVRINGAHQTSHPHLPLQYDVSTRPAEISANAGDGIWRSENTARGLSSVSQNSGSNAYMASPGNLQYQQVDARIAGTGRIFADGTRSTDSSMRNITHHTCSEVFTQNTQNPTAMDNTTSTQVTQSLHVFYSFKIYITQYMHT